MRERRACGRKIADAVLRGLRHHDNDWFIPYTELILAPSGHILGGWLMTRAEPQLEQDRRDIWSFQPTTDPSEKKP